MRLVARGGGQNYGVFSSYEGEVGFDAEINPLSTWLTGKDRYIPFLFPSKCVRDERP